MISANLLRDRKADIQVNDWMLDSGAFTEVTKYGGYRSGVQAYADQIKRWRSCGNMLCAVSQDYMCEPFALAKTGLTVEDHQRLTIERFVDLLQVSDDDTPILPVLQGWKPEDYARHVEWYGDLLPQNAWVGVGSVCKRNAKPESVLEILRSVVSVRPDLNLHGFGLKVSALRNESIRSILYSSDSMAWSFAARRGRRDANSWREADKYVRAVEQDTLGYDAFWTDTGDENE